MNSVIAFLGTLLLSTNNIGPEYTVEKSMGNFEIRTYEPWIVAETYVKGTFDSAGNDAFRILAGYIFGGNADKARIEMTAPVTQQQVGEGEFLVQFYMPKEWTLNTLPKPNDPRVNLRQLPEKRVFVERYHGGWSTKLYNEELNSVENKMNDLNIKSKGEPIWARYNSPMAIAPLRTNEIQFLI